MAAAATSSTSGAKPTTAAATVDPSTVWTRKYQQELKSVERVINVLLGDIDVSNVPFEIKDELRNRIQGYIDNSEKYESNVKIKDQFTTLKKQFTTVNEYNIGMEDLKTLRNEIESMAKEFREERKQYVKDPAVQGLHISVTQQLQGLKQKINELYLSKKPIKYPDTDRLREIEDILSTVDDELENMDTFTSKDKDVLKRIESIIKDSSRSISEIGETYSKGDIEKKDVIEIRSIDSDIDETFSAKANEFLSLVKSDGDKLKSALQSNNMRMMTDTLQGLDYEKGDDIQSKIQRDERALKIAKEALKKSEDNLRNLASTDTRAINNAENAVRLNQNKVTELEERLEKTKQSLLGAVTLKLTDFMAGFDVNLASLRKYQEDLRTRLKILESAKDKELQNKLRDALRANFDDFYNRLIDPLSKSQFPVIGGFGVFMVQHIENARRKKWPKSQIDVLMSIKTLADDNADEIRIGLATIHDEIIRSIKIATDSKKIDYSAVSMLYGMKVLRVSVSWLAFYLANKLFMDYYNKQISATSPKVVDLRWYVVIYASFQLVFDIMALVVMYFVRRIDPEVVPGALMLDYVFDTAIVTMTVLASAIWVADIIQDKRYFSYQTRAPRAVRALRTIIFWLLVFHSLAPYFYLAGPNFSGREKSKELDKNVAKVKAGQGTA